jgi:predicted membrane protein
MKTISIFGGSKIGQRHWRPGKKVWSIAIFGGCDMDFRQAELEEGVTKIVAISILGGHKVIVPQDLPVSLSGFSLLGGREMKRSQAKETPQASAKALHINAISILGGFEVTE